MRAFPSINHQRSSSARLLNKHQKAPTLKHRRSAERKVESRMRNNNIKEKGCQAHLLEITISGGKM
jgi:hypothetical protein